MAQLTLARYPTWKIDDGIICTIAHWYIVFNCVSELFFLAQVISFIFSSNVDGHFLWNINMSNINITLVIFFSNFRVLQTYVV